MKGVSYILVNTVPFEMFPVTVSVCLNGSICAMGIFLILWMEVDVSCM